MRNILIKDDAIGVKRVIVEDPETGQGWTVDYRHKVSAITVASIYTSLGPISIYIAKHKYPTLPTNSDGLPFEDLLDVIKQEETVIEIDLLATSDVNDSISKFDTTPILRKYYKEAGDELGCSCSVFANMLRGTTHKVYIAPNKRFINRFAIAWVYSKENKKMVPVHNNTLIHTVNKNAHIGYDYVNDNMEHMAGFGVVFGLTVTKAKAILGKNLWKRLCHNSRSRNDLIVNALSVYSEEDISLSARILERTPSTLLKHYTTEATRMLNLEAEYKVQNATKKIIEHIAKPLYKIDRNEISRICNVISDTKRMCDQQGVAFNPNWGIRRMCKEHSSLSKSIVLGDASKEAFHIVDFLQNEYVDGKFRATLVRSEYDLKSLGVEQNHCVGSYSYNCNRGEYAVYRITDDIGTVSTLGINNHAGFNAQHYFAFNRPIEDQDRLSFGRVVASKVIKDFDKVPIIKVDPDKYLNRPQHINNVMLPAAPAPINDYYFDLENAPF